MANSEILMLPKKAACITRSHSALDMFVKLPRTTVGVLHIEHGIEAGP